MTRPLWARVDDLYHAALEKPPAEREAFLDQACSGDEELRNEVQSLLNYEREADRLMERPAASAATQKLAVTRGTRLGPYEVIDLLGAGGMGEVYRATDTRLGRDVAVKVLPAEVASDPERLRRFEREARAVASLNHPHILTVHDVGSHGGTHYVVTELLEGETLREVLERRPPSLKQALSLAVQAAQGLAAAHRKGVVHRDVKPENLFVTAEGAVKVLDFGLAKLVQGEQGATEDATTLDARAKLSQPGTVAGTPAYMSPEQAQGLAVDARSDIFSFGVVLYELLTRTHPFRRDTAPATLGAIVEAEPRPPAQLAPALPPDLEKIVLRCLRKDPDRRFQSMTDVELELEEVTTELAAGSTLSPVPASPRRGRRALAAVAALVFVAVAVGLWLRLSPRALPPPRLVQLTSFSGDEVHPALSPDGRQMAFAWNGEKRDNLDVYVQMIGGDRPLRLTTDPAADSQPAWPPDGREIAFRRATPVGAAVYVVSALGGPERKVADLRRVVASWPSLSWTPDGKGLVTVDSDAREGEGIYLIPLGSGERRRLTPKPEYAQSAPRLSPDGRLLAYTDCTAEYRCVVQVQGLGAGYAPEGPPRPLVEAGRVLGLAWSRDGRSLIYSGRDYHLQRVSLSDPSRPERVELAGRRASGPTVAGNLLAFARDADDSDIWRVTEGAGPEPFISSTRRDNQPRYSPDGKRLAFCSNRSSEVVEVFVSESDGSNPMQLTHGPGLEHCSPTWSPDGRRITFDSQAEDAHWDVYVIDAAGGNPRFSPRVRPTRTSPSGHGTAGGFTSRRTGPAGSRSGALPRREETRCGSPGPAASAPRSPPTVAASTTSSGNRGPSACSRCPWRAARSGRSWTPSGR